MFVGKAKILPRVEHLKDWEKIADVWKKVAKTVAKKPKYLHQSLFGKSPKFTSNPL
jgi:hypothetical protein